MALLSPTAKAVFTREATRPMARVPRGATLQVRLRSPMTRPRKSSGTRRVRTVVEATWVTE